MKSTIILLPLIIGSLFNSIDARALVIDATYIAPGQFSTFSRTLMGAESRNIAGGGTLESVVSAAASHWSSLFADDHLLRLEFGWADLGSNVLAQAAPLGFPAPFEVAVIQFNNRTFPWFLDTSPLDHSDYPTFETSIQDLGSGPVNTGVVYGGGSGDAAGFDLFSVALHEVGHALGFAFLDAFGHGDGFVDITAPRPLAGSRIPLAQDFSHINFPDSVLFPSGSLAERHLPSDADILAIAEVNGWAGVTLNDNLTAVPIPATAWLFGSGLLGLVGAARQSRSGRAAALRHRAGIILGIALVVTTGARADTVTTIAGTGIESFSGDGGPATSATLYLPLGIATAPDGTVYFADNGNFRIRSISPAGIITTLAGNGNIGNTGEGGPATDATMTGVMSLALDPATNLLYFADFDNSLVRRIDLTSGIISTLAGGNFDSVLGDGGPVGAARLMFPLSVAVDGVGDVYISDLFDCRVRKVDVSTGVIQTVAGNGACIAAGDGGPATSASLEEPIRVALDADGNLYILEQLANTVRRVDAVTGIIATVAGGGAAVPGFGPATDMNLGLVMDLAIDAAGDLFISNFNGQIYKVDMGTGLLTVHAGAGSPGFGGDGGPAISASFWQIGGLAFKSTGELIVSDTGNGRVRAIVPDPVVVDPFDLIVSPETTQALLDAATDIDGSVILVEVDGRTILLIPNLASVGLDVTLQDNDQLLAIDLGALASVGGNIDISGNLVLATLDLGALTDVSGNLNIVDNPNLSAVLISGVTQIGGDLSIIGSAATLISLPALTSVTGSIDVTDNTVATSIDLGSLATAGGGVDVTGNTAATSVDLGSLTQAGGAVDVTGNTEATVIDLGAVQTVGGAVDVSGNSSATEIDLASLVTVGGTVDVSGNTVATSVDLSSLTQAGGAVDVTGNTEATVIDLGAVQTVGGAVDVSGNTSATVIDLASVTTVGGVIDVSGNATAAIVDLGSLETAGGVNVTGNGPGTSVDIGSLTTVTGDVAVESTGTGSFDAGPANVAGNTSLTLDGYSAVTASTAGGTTDVSNATPDAVMRLHIQAATFATPVAFTATRLDALTLVPESGTSAEGVATVDPIAAYQFAFDIPTLGLEAALSFEVTLAGLDAATQQALLDGLAAGTATLATKGDAAGSSYQAFPLCSGATVPTVDGCVLVEMFDANGNPITSGTPASVRFSNVVGHFSVWAVAIVTPQGSGGDTGGEEGQGEPCPPLSADACLDDTGYDLVSYHRFTLSDGVPGIQEVDFGAHAGAGMVVVRNYGCAAAQTRLNDGDLSQPAAQVPLPPCSSQAVTLKDSNRFGIELSGDPECTVKVAIVAPACRVSSIE